MKGFIPVGAGRLFICAADGIKKIGPAVFRGTKDRLKEGYVKVIVNKLEIRGARPIFLSDRISRGWPRNLSRDKELSG
jgi:hypothetical protein